MPSPKKIVVDCTPVESDTFTVKDTDKGLEPESGEADMVIEGGEFGIELVGVNN